mmetsp:Transcript_55196/g.103479  ORF Transcript_55196/g.103479 Transcript_55196/m.103479 type:complete len:167 (+) Transcript_55196:90-590(+)
MLTRLLAIVLAIQSRAESSGTVEVPLQEAPAPPGLGLGPQMDATLRPRSAGVESVELTGAGTGLSGGPVGGLGLQMRAVESPRLGLGPQLDARITPGRPVPSLRQAGELAGVPWDLLLRAAICLIGMAMVYLAVAHREAEQGRLSGVKSFFGALSKNRNSDKAEKK